MSALPVPAPRVPATATPEPAPARIVVIDDEPLAAAELVELLQALGHPQASALTLGRGAAPSGTAPVGAAPAAWLTALRDEQPELLLLELSGPGALALLQALQADRLLRQVPVIATQAEDRPAERLRALQLQAADVLLKPLDAAEFALRLRNTLDHKARLDQLTYTDGTTGLPNREWSLRRLDEAIRASRRYGHSGAVLQVGLNRFRQINDALGLTLTDELLHEVGRRLATCVRDTDLVSRAPEAKPGDAQEAAARVARGDGDEFTILLPQLDRAEHASVVAQRIAEAMRAPLQVAGHEVFVGCRIGIAVFPGDGLDKDSVLERAILAMRHGRTDSSSAGTPVRFYSQALHGRFTSRLAVERELHHALERQELQLLYQPKVSMRDGRICGAEALVRWQHPARGRLGPAAFIDVAEETGLILPLGAWVLGEAIRQMAAWRRAGLPALPVAVNVSSFQLRRPGLADTVRTALQAQGVDGDQLCLELTESAIMDTGASVADTFTAIKRLGVRLALDDFGTGYSSLSYLRRFPLDELKIDRSFIAECAGGQGSAAVITRAVIAMAHGLGLRVVAEGIETEAQLKYLRQQRCDQFQGYLYSPPVSATEFEQLLRSEAPPDDGSSSAGALTRLDPGGDPGNETLLGSPIL
ncbi:MAG TPA: EAL domain-containing protein [Burkholderiaceae bacterium]|nr:EAL domain-containing protein [Burkholderiaceae bacterium]HNB46112.1 EAL domain-containing protein [Burkholderiaceae bacterium]HNG81521.1 EAL domain-containing protein [Burkholderiaceae bacterium]